MQTSNLPDGTVFIVVAAILGSMAMSVLLWRGLVAWSLHRSVKRAASQHIWTTRLHCSEHLPLLLHFTSTRTGIQLFPFRDWDIRAKEQPPRELVELVITVEVRRTCSSAPTAGAVGTGGHGGIGAGNRGSNYLPSGYYAAGNSAAGNGQGHIPVGGQVHSQGISMSTLRPESQGYGRARSVGHSPPDSPGLSAERGHMASSSTLNLNHGYGGNERAPSAYLEDLIDGDNTTPPVPGHGHGHGRI